ncbi:type II secretion system protein GspE [Superficieibacter electus]|uniref:Type II secretion system protein GspE n=1 Tax=Superficieibacter electus TaxID=2022662 RepID=A0A2P5GM91_9ENTR|nr:type II secretion system protein GspE [Superficieibacter electus]POP42039.1 type II secretion system protein GspE [Superficieibacter electus]POP46960.1 type II secretion system protein GspE [Superficieibacter electus]
MKREQLIALCKRYGAVLLNSDDEMLNIAVVGEPGSQLLESLRFATQKRIDIECWSQEKMDQHLHMATQTHLPAVNKGSGTAVELLNQTLEQALLQRASDIHFEPLADRMRVRLRVDGVLHPLTALPFAQTATVIARLKVLGNLDIAERRVPQDGQFTVELAGKSVSFRIATLPAKYGEKVVLRLLHQVEQTLDIRQLGMTACQHKAFSSALKRPQGLLLVTGPTGSGKTVTLYSALQSLNTPAVNICSVEDPVEIPLEGINQTQINPRAGLTFQNVLRAFLRQDPDIIMVGEIRDGDTAEIAIKAAQTGHLVLSTLHTNSTTEALVRLQQMGVARWMLSSSLLLVVAQRLVRKLCPHCRTRNGEHTAVPPSLWRRPLPRWHAGGCDHCYHGFYGRIALFEVLPVEGELRQAIAGELSTEDIHAQARRDGMTTLFENGCLAVEQGLTTVEELLRVLGTPYEN